MALDFLEPLSEGVVSCVEELAEQSLGVVIEKHTVASGLPQLNGVDVAIIGIAEDRNCYDATRFFPFDLEAFRIQLYQLKVGNWNVKIIDLEMFLKEQL